MKLNKMLLIWAAIGVLGLGSIAACGEYGHNAPKASRDTAPADIINFPQGFRNVAHKCDGPNMIYVTSHGTDSQVEIPSAVFVVAGDPRCKS